MHEIQIVSDLYKPLSIMSAKIYFTLEKLGSIHYLYQFSLQSYMAIIYSIIEENLELKQIPKSDPETRL